MALRHGSDNPRKFHPVFAVVFFRQLMLGLRELERRLIFDPALGLLLQVFEAGIDRQFFTLLRRGGIASSGSVHENPFLLRPWSAKPGKETVRICGFDRWVEPFPRTRMPPVEA